VNAALVTRTCRLVRPICALIAALVLFLILQSLCFDLYLIARREVFRAAELVGIMDANGDLGGQVMGFNHQRYPQWVYPAGRFTAAVAIYGPVLILSLLTLHRIDRGTLGLRSTLCGKCGSTMKSLTEPRCTSCREMF
jgi:hypothetical protein